jgi:hypothetical protein
LQLGISPSSRARPTNIIVDAAAKLPFSYNSTARNYKKHSYYYSNVPSARDAAVLFLSSTKKGKGKAQAVDSDKEIGD